MDLGVAEICRLCRCVNNMLLTDIFDDIPDEEPIASKIWNCLNLEASLDDGLPRYICHRCFSDLNRFNVFRKICHESDVCFRKRSVSSSVWNTTHFEGMDVKSEPANLNPVSSGIGHILEGSERTLNGFESDGSHVTDQSYVSSRPLSIVNTEEGSHSATVVFEQSLDVESVPGVSTSVNNVYVDKDSEGTSHALESDYHDVINGSHYTPSSPCPNSLPNYNECNSEPENVQTSHHISHSPSLTNGSLVYLPLLNALNLLVVERNAHVHFIVQQLHN